MFNTFSEIPTEQRNFILSYFNAWQGKVSQVDTYYAKAFVRESFVYMLRMLWQARYDKMSSETKENFDWISKNFLPDSVPYAGATKVRELLIPSDFNHDKLAEDVFSDLWALYQFSEFSGLEEPDADFIANAWRKIKKFFNPKGK